MANQVTYSFIASDKFTRVAKRVARTARDVGNKFKRLGADADKASRKTGRFFAMMKRGARGLVGPLAAMTGAFTAVAVGAKFMRDGLDFGDQMADLSAITNITGDQLKFLGDESKRLGVDAAVGATQVAESFKLVASANDQLKETKGALSEVVEQALLLKNASGEELANATTALVGSLNQYSAGSEKAARFTDILAASAQVGNAELVDLAPAITNVGGVAASMGIPFETLNAALQVLAAGEEKGSRAGNALRSTLQRLDAIGVSPIGKKMKKAGIDVEQFRPSVVGLTGALDNLNQLIVDRGLQSQRIPLLTALFGEDASRIGNILLRDTEMLKRFNKELGVQGVASAQAATRLATPSARLRRLGVRLTNVLLKGFEKFEPKLNKMISGAERFFEGLTSQEIDDFATKIATVAGAVADLAKAMGGLALVLSNPKEAFLETLRFARTEEGQASLAAFGASGPSTADFKRAFGAGDAAAGRTSRIEFEGTLNAPAGVVKETNVKTSGQTAGLNVGMNLVEAPGGA